MTGLIQKIESQTQGIAPEWTNLHVLPRGLPRFVDVHIRGQARNCKKIGGSIPTLQPNNRTTLSAVAQAHQFSITVTTILPSMVPGSLVLLDGRELIKIEDVIPATNQLIASSEVLVNHDVGESVDLYAEVATIIGSVPATAPATYSYNNGAGGISLVAKQDGIYGNADSIEFVVPTAPNVPESATVVGNHTVVVLHTNTSATVVSTMASVVATINSSGGQLTATATGTTTALVGVLSVVYLSGGAETTTFQVRCKHRVLTGDQLYIQADPDLLLSGTEYTVVDSIQLPVTVDLYQAEVIIDHPIPRDLEIDDVIYLRSFPAYFSPIVNVPVNRRQPIPLGPFVVDYVSGRFNDGEVIGEALDVQLYNSLGATVETTTPQTMVKNTPVIRVPIHASAFVFMDLVRGSMGYRNDKFVLKCDGDGYAILNTELAPEWPVGHWWAANVRAVSTGTTLSVTYRFNPNDYKLAGGLLPNKLSTLTFGLPNGDLPANKLEIALRGSPGAELEMANWIPSNGVSPIHPVTKLQYSLVGRAVGGDTWQTGSLQIKPYFPTMADIAFQMDESILDNGTVLI